MSPTSTIEKKAKCYHCGDVCFSGSISVAGKLFCCEGCKLVYRLLNQNDLCEYYNLNETPGITQRIKVRKDKFAFLDDESIQGKLISFRDEKQVHASFYLPQMHCSSCLYLLENLHKLHSGIISSKVNFTRKEADIVFNSNKISFREVAELLAGTGYEPYISLNDLQQKRPSVNKSLIYRLGVAGFCFGNVMLMSFPEYFGIDAGETSLRAIFRWMNFFLAIPVFLYSVWPFYESSWKSLKHCFLNIDAPIALAIIITFIRSGWEVITASGSGYFDSMTGIVFFMLAGRILQDKTYRQLSFERDYTSYFPVAVSVLKDGVEVPTVLPSIKPGDTLIIHNEELIPADGILTRGKAFVDYSFVTGESIPVSKDTGELVYAGGKQTGGNIEILVVKEVAQSYLTSLWSREEFKQEAPKPASFVHLLSRWFTYIVLIIAASAAVYWKLHDSARVWSAVTAIFIIACPCALLLSNTFTNGNILRILGRNHFYLRSAQTIESLADITHVVFDKTGTLTSNLEQQIDYEGSPLTELQLQKLAALANCSNHPLSRMLAKKMSVYNKGTFTDAFKETSGEGIEGYIGDEIVKIGSEKFVTGKTGIVLETSVFVSFDNKPWGCFHFSNHYRDGSPGLLKELRKRYNLSVLSGDNEMEEQNLRKLFGERSTLLFHQKPEDKLIYIKKLQSKGEKVMMIGDGLNDAGALKQSDVGVAISEQTNNFTPASDAIIEAKRFTDLGKFIKVCRANKKIVKGSFILSIVYNLIGLFFAVQGTLFPLIAAILMPSSSLSILLITFGSSSLLASKMKL